MLYKDLREKVFAVVDYPNELTDLIGEAEPWKDFCALKQEEKNAFADLGHVDDSEAGYTLRLKDAGREDKEYFHYYPGLEEKMSITSASAEASETVNAFGTYASKVHTETVNFSNQLIKELGEDIPELVKLLNSGDMRYLLRFLHYTNEAPGIAAAQHFDRSLFTLHLYESEPGLQFLNFDMKWQDAPIGRGKTVIFNGYRMEKLTKGNLQKTWHRVIDGKGGSGRHSTVLFLWSPKVESYPEESRAQDEIPSYQM